MTAKDYTELLAGLKRTFVRPSTLRDATLPRRENTDDLRTSFTSSFVPMSGNDCAKLLAMFGVADVVKDQAGIEAKIVAKEQGVA